MVGAVGVLSSSVLEGGKPASQVVQSPRLGILSRVLYDTIATHKSISVPNLAFFSLSIGSFREEGMSVVDLAYRLELAIENCLALMRGKASKM
jgi:aminopeptidase-like protein